MVWDVVGCCGVYGGGDCVVCVVCCVVVVGC